MPVLVTFLTPVLPGRSRHLAQTASSVAAAITQLRDIGCRASWIVVVDGPGRIPKVNVEHQLIRLGERRGVAAARNVALATASPGWIVPLDADDILVPEGLCEVLSKHPWADDKSSPTAIKWISTNRLFFNGRQTAHWRNSQKNWTPGTLSECWTSPFPFHPNSIIVDRELALCAGGWPALPGNEDLGFCLAISELSSGLSTVVVTLRYRRWGKQEVSRRAYAGDKEFSFKLIEALTNSTRLCHGRQSVHAPVKPGPAFGVQEL
jgi:glycosyl transferase family 2